MCAAPGSKTAQLIEMIHADDGGSPSASSLPGTYIVYSQCTVFYIFGTILPLCSRCRISYT